MTPEELQALQAAKNELEKIKKQNRDRAARYLDRRREAGKKQISAIVHIDVYEEINRRRDRSLLADAPLTAGQIIEQALLATKDFVALDGKVDIDAISDMSEAYDKALTSSSVNINNTKDTKEAQNNTVNINGNIKENIQEVQLESVKPPYPNSQLDLINGGVVEEVDEDLEFIFNPALEWSTANRNTEYKAWVIGIIKKLHQKPFTYARIKEELEKRGVKTITGLDVWSIGTIGNILKKGR